MGNVNWLLGFASVFTLAALACIAVSFSTDFWIVTTVDRDDRGSVTPPDVWESPIGFTRERGLFRTCYEGNETLFLEADEYEDDVVDGNCLREKGYELTRRERTNGYPSEYDTRIQLMRSHFAFFIVSMLFLIVGIVLGIVGCWQLKVSVLQISGLVVFIGAFFGAGGMAMFHGYDYLEREKLDNQDVQDNYEDFPAYWQSVATYRGLEEASKREYGYSYMLGWISVCLAAIGAILFLCASFSYKPPRAQERKEKEAAYSYGNEGYDYSYPTYPAVSQYGGYGYGY